MDDARFRRTVRQILRVNYAGEYGAMRIYGAQIRISRALNPDIVQFLEHTRGHEIRHAARFLSLMPARATRPCGATFVWGLGGALLGGATALLGRNGIMICTEAVERTVHRHLNEQLVWLAGRDRELAEAILEIRDEELGHRKDAEMRRSCYRLPARSLDWSICALTDFLIWGSTYGASTRRLAP
jgi:ubiquinone biosynthesis monooxygenase Coq7